MSEDAHTLIQRGHALRREERADDAWQRFSEAVAAARREGNDSVLVHALMGVGQIERDLGRGERALPLYEEAVELCLALDDLRLLAHTLRHLGELHLDLGNLSTAALPWEQALAWYGGTEGTSTFELANAVRPCARLREGLGDAEAALALWREARDLYQAAGSEAGVRECSRHLD